MNLAGEKLSEAHVINAMAEACRKTGAQLMDYSVAGEVGKDIPHYTIAAMSNGGVDSSDFVHAFEEAVGNVDWEFINLRGMGALGPTVLVKMRTSQHEEIVKSTHLQAKPVPLTTDRSVFEVCEEATQEEPFETCSHGLQAVSFCGFPLPHKLVKSEFQREDGSAQLRRKKGV